MEIAYLDNHPISCQCKECEAEICTKARNAFYTYLGKGDISRQRKMFIEFYCLWYKDNWDNENNEDNNNE